MTALKHQKEQELAEFHAFFIFVFDIPLPWGAPRRGSGLFCSKIGVGGDRFVTLPLVLQRIWEDVVVRVLFRVRFSMWGARAGPALGPRPRRKIRGWGA